MPVRRFQLLAFEDIMLLQGALLEEGSLQLPEEQERGVPGVQAARAG